MTKFVVILLDILALVSKFNERRLKGFVVKLVVTSIPTKKPKSGVKFFRIMPGSEWKFPTYMLDLGGKGDG
jgi:hypothetical protein